MGGLAVLLIIAAYIGLACAIAYKIKSKKWKIVAIVAAILVPTTDAVVGRLYLQHLCATKGGFKIYRVVEGVEGFYDGRWRPTSEWLTKYEYRFVEGKDLDGKPRR